MTRHFGKGKASRKAFGKASRKGMANGTGKAAGAAAPAARLDFEMIEARVLLSADINPALGSAALDLSGADTAQIIAAKLEAAAAEPVLEIAETASPQGAGVDLSTLDMTFLDRGLLAVPGTQVDVATTSADLDETTTEAIFTELLEGGQSVALSVNATGDLSLRVELRDPEGAVIVTLEAGETLGAPVQLAATGTYTLSLQRLAGAGSANAALILNAVVEAELPGTGTNDDFASAESLTPSTLAFGTDARQLAAFGDVQIDSDDVWSFDVAEGDVLTLISALNLTDAPQIALYAADGRQLAVGEGEVGPYAIIDGLTLRAEDAGTVYVVISGEGAYALTGLVNASYMNPIIADAPRDLGQTGLGQGEIDSGLVVDPGTGGESYLYLEETENGDVVEGAIWIDGPAAGDSLIIEGDGFVGNNIAEGLADRDFITIDMAAGGDLSLEVWGTDETFIPRVSVFDSAGTLITSASAIEGPARVSIVNPFSETYYVAISAAGDTEFDAFTHDGAAPGDTGSYAIYFALTGGGPGEVIPADLTTVERDDTLATATALDLPLFANGSTTVSGAIGDVNGTADRDLYRVFLRAGDTITGAVTAARAGTGLDPILSVFDASGARLAYNDDYDGLDSRLTFTSAANGYYYFGITSYSNFNYNPTLPAAGNGSGGSTGSYQIAFDVVRNLSAANASLYQVQAEAGDTLVLRTATPGDAAGLPDNLLDPALGLYGPDGTLLASNLNGAADGRNAEISYTVTEAGTYLIEVLAEAGRGLYRIEVEGASGSQTRAPQLVGSSIDDVGVLAEAPEFIDVSFDVAIYGGDLGAGLLTIDGVAAQGVTLIGADTLRFDIAGMITADGAHEIVLAGGIRSLAGGTAEGASWTLMTDFIAPEIALSSPAAGGRVAPGQQEIEITFSEALSLNLAGLGDFALYDVINDTYLGLDSFEVVDMTTLRVRFEAPLAEGLYRFEINTASAAMVDAVGNPLADGTVTFGVDAGALTAAFSASSPLVLGAYVADIAGALDQGDDVDSHAFTLGAGQRLLVSGGTSAGVHAQFSLQTAEGVVIWQATTDGSGLPVRMAASQALVAGDYRLVITGQGDIGAYGASVLINSELEAEATGGADNASTAEALDQTAISFSGVQTWATMGSLSDGADVDSYDFALAAGQSVSFVLHGQMNFDAALDLYAPDGTLISRATRMDDGMLLIDGLTATETGRYRLVVRAQDGQGGRYGLGAVQGAAVEIENKDMGPRVIGDGQTILGALGEDARNNTTLRIAVVTGSQSTITGYTRTAAQLNDSTLYDFEAVVVAPSAIDSLAELSEYDVVLIGNDGGSSSTGDQFAVYAAALADWVASGGSVVMTGWGAYGSGNETTATVAALNSFSPVVLGSGYSSTSSFIPTAVEHPVTAGIPTFTGSYIEYPYGGLTSGAVALATTSGGYVTAAVKSTGAGRAVYLGMSYVYRYSSGTDYTVGFPDQLLEQAVDWAGVTGLDHRDDYLVDLAAGEVLTLETLTPNDGAGLPENEADLRIQVYNMDGVLVAQNNDGAADGRNARLSFTPGAADAGRYRVVVSREAGSQLRAQYLLQVSGGAEVEQSFEVVAADPGLGGATVSVPDAIVIEFSQAVRLDSIDLSDLVIDGGALVTSAELLDGNSVRFGLTLDSVDRVYSWSLAEGALTAMNGASLSAAASSFHVDMVAPWVEAVSPSPEASRPFTSLAFTFSEPLDAFSVNILDVLSFTGPDGSDLRSTITGVTVNGAVVTITFSERTLHGSYTLILGPEITDIAGNAMADPDTGATTFTAVVALRSSDLTVSDIEAPADLRFGEAFSLTYTVTNTGQDPAQGSWYDRVVLRNASGGIAWYGNTYTRPTLSDQGNPIPGLEPGDSYTRTLQVTLPLTYSLAEGAYTVEILSDYSNSLPEISETNNAGAVAVNVTYPPLADLSVATFPIPTEALSGQTLALSWVVSNTGAASASGWTDRIYLSTDPTYGSDTYLGDFTYSGTLAAGASVTRTQNITLPATIDGTYYLIVVSDVYGTVFEGITGGETNNVTVSGNPVTVSLQPFPNLVVSQVIAPEAAASSQPITIQWDVTNTGTAATGSTAWYDHVYLSLDEIIGNEDDVYLGTVRNPSYLAVGESYRNSLTATLPTGIEGTYYIGVRADAYNYVVEFGNEGDNTRVSAPVAVSLTPPADLQVTNVVSPAQAFSGQSTQLTWTVTNAGQGATLETGWYDRVYMSLDGELSGDDIDLGRVWHAGRLAAGEAYTVTHNVTLPVGVSGDYVLIVATDDGNRVYEFIYEDNNTGTDIDDTGAPDVTQVLLTPPPDLVLELTSVPEPIVAGRAQRITYQVFNDGATATPNSYWYDRFYLSSDAVLDASDQLVGSAYHTSGYQGGVYVNGHLQSGGSYTGALYVTLPDGLLGDYYLIGVADADGTVFELNRANNADAVQINAVVSAADLVLSGFTAPGEGIAGGAINLSWSVANQGEGDTVTNAWGDRIVLSSDAVYGNADDIELLIRAAGQGILQPGGAYSVENVTVALPVDLASGSWYLFAATDGRGTVFESGREANNISAAQAITITRRSPDLVTSAVTLVGADGAGDLSATAGRNIQVRYTVTNTAAAATERTNWNDGIYLVAEDGTATLLGRAYRSNRLEAGASYTQTATVFLPLDAVAGAYRIEVRADVGNVVIEDGAEDNNAATSAGVLTLAAYAGGTIDTPPDGSDPFAALTPNLSVADLSYTGGDWAGGLIEVTWTVENNGPQTTANQTWYDQVYLSLDDQFDAGTDISLGYVAHTTLAAGESYQLTRSFRIPAGIAGDYRVILVTDSSHRVAELNEGDNIRVADAVLSIAVPPPADLVVGTITVPETGESGLPVSITYTATNAGTNAAVGQWIDRLYLSADGAWDINDAYIGQLTISGPVAAGASYTRTLTAALPGVLPGTYQVIVRSDITNAVQETDETNNSGLSDDQIAADAPVLVLGEEAGGTIAANGGVYYKVSLTAGDAVRISVDRTASSGATELYASFGTIPNRTTYDFAALEPFETDQSLLIPVEVSGDYYIFIRSQSGTATPFTVLAEVVPFSLAAAEPGVVSNTGRSTFEVTGARFREDTTFELVAADGTVVAADLVTIDSSVRAYVRFDLNGAAAGEWLLRATNGDTAVDLDAPITVSDTLLPGSVDVTLAGPATVRPDRLNMLQVDYANVGGTDVGAPLIILSSSTGTPMGLTVGSVSAGDLQILGLDPSGLSEILRAGATSSISVLFRSGTVAQGVRISARAVTERDTTLIEDWAVIEAALRPADLTDADWNAFWQRLQPRIGETWGQYVRVLNTLSKMLAADGLESRDLRTMMRAVYDNLGDYLPSVAFSGRLVGAEGGAVPANVEIQAYLMEDGEFYLNGTTVTDSEGNFSFAYLQPGSYRLVLTNAAEIDDAGNPLGAITYFGFDLDRDGVADDLPVNALLPSDGDVSGIELGVVELPAETTEGTQASDPLLANDAAGRLHMVWAQDGVLMHAVNDGTGWSTAQEILGTEAARDVQFLIHPTLIDATTEGLMLTWLGGDGNASEVYYTLGERLEDGSYRWGLPTAVTQDEFFDTGLAAGIDENGQAVFLYEKSDFDDETDDSDIYTQSVDPELTPYAVVVEFAVSEENADAFEAYLETLSADELEALGIVRLPRIGIQLWRWFQFRLDATLRYDESQARLVANLAINAKFEALGLKFEVEGRGNFGYNWHVDPDTCEWVEDTGRMDFRAGGAADFPLTQVIGKLGPVGAGIAAFLKLVKGPEPSFRLEGAYTVQANYNNWSSVLMNPSTASGTAMLAGGFNLKWKGVTFFGSAEITARALMQFRWKFEPGSGFTMADPFITGSAMVRAKWDVNIFGYKREFFVDATVSWPSGESLGVDGAPLYGYQMVNLGTGEIVSQPTQTFDDGDVVETFGELPAAIGSMADLSGTNESAVTSNLTYDGEPIIARAADGSLTGAWMTEAGIVVSRYDAEAKLWAERRLAVAYDDTYAYRDVTLTFDGNGDGVMVWNRLDVSALLDGTPVDYARFQEIMGQGGQLVFSTYDAATDSWSEISVLQDLTGREHSFAATRLANGDIVASWLLSATEETELADVYAATWSAASNSWSAPVLLAAASASGAPAVSALAGQPVVIWSAPSAASETTTAGLELVMAVLGEAGWSAAAPLGVVLPTAVETAAEDVALSPEGLWAITSYLPTPDQENCECEDDDCDDDYEPDVQRPSDPNDIIGPVGAGELNWVTTQEAFGYTIRFENEPTATAAAQVVTITQQLDDDLNWNSFRIDDFGWGDLVFEVDATSPFYTNRFDFVESHGFYVDVTAAIDISTGIATWTLSTIDPATGEPPLEAALGFLPVNDETGRGEGFVSYRIAAPRNADSGDRIDAVARIVFDTEAPIDTPPIFNTLDVVAPTSEVLALPERSDETEILVRWTSADDEGGSSVAGVSVYVSMDGGTWSLWLEDTTLSEAVFVGEAGHAYAFYSVARDVAGWLEAAPETADAAVLIGQQPGAIAGVVFIDTNGNGVQDVGETGQGDVIVYLDLDGNGTLDPTDYAVLTEADGSYLFEGLEPGSYTLLTDLPSDYLVTGAAAGGAQIEVVADATAAGPAVGLFATASLSGTLFRDGTGPVDGLRDASEPGLAGWTVFLDADGDGVLDAGEARVVTDLSGTYAFADLGPGAVTLRVLVQDGFEATLPVGAAYTVTPTSGMDATALDFGFRLIPAAIRGVKFEDTNGNGQRDAGEAGLAGWTIFLDADGDGILDAGERSTVTAADGSYAFEGLTPGSYIVAEVAQTGWAQTYPGAGPFTVGTRVITTTALDIAMESPAVPLEVADIDPTAAAGADWADALTGMDDFRADTRFSDITGTRTTVVSIDTGIDLDHGFFGADADGNGVADRIVFSYDFADGDADASDVTGHGTAIAGIIGGDDATYGGLAPEVDIISLKVFRDSGAGYFSQLERALQWVVLNAEDYGVGVVNLSLGDSGNWTEAVSRYGLGDELATLADMGIIVIAATGNSYASFDTEGVAYPAADPNVIGVGAVWAGDYGGPWYFSNGATDYTTDADRITSFTQRDDELLDILAPGAQLVTAGLNGGLAAVQGTSHAAAYLSGVAVLAQDLALREFGKQLSAAQFSALLSQTAIFVVDGDDERDNVVNTGLSFPRVDVMALAEAILALDPASFEGTSGEEPTDPGTTSSGQLASAGTQSVTVGAGDTATGVDFGSFELISLSGTIYDDADGNGQQDAGEAGLAGITVFLDADGDGVLGAGEAFALTDASGAYTLAPVGPGPVKVAVVAPEGAAEVAPVTVATLSGDDQTGIDFGLDFGPGEPVSLVVDTVQATADGFAVRFNQAIDLTAFGAGGPLSAIELRNAAGQVVRGSVIFDADAMGLRFIATGASLRDASYSLRLAAGSFQAATGALDGNADGTAGDDFTTSFTGPAGGAAVLAIGEIARGAGQSLAQPTLRPGMAITLSGAAGLTELAFRLDFDAAVFDITGLQLGTGLPAGSTLEVVSLSGGSLSAVLRLGTALASDGAITIGYLLGAIDASATAGATGLLDLSVTAVTGIAAVQDDDGFALVQMVGDLDGDGAYSAADYQAMLATNLSDAPRTGMIDFTVLADMNGDGAITLTDRTLLFRASRGVISPQVPALATVTQTGALAAARVTTAAPVAAAPVTPAPVPVLGANGPAPSVAPAAAAAAAPLASGLLDLTAQASNFGLSAASASALSAPKVTSLLAARRALV